MPRDTKTELLDFAEDAVRARGFDGFSYADLAEAVGIRKASIHHHFPTKAGLSAALMARYHQTIAKTCEEITIANQKASHRLLGLIAMYRAALRNGQTLCLCVSLTTSRQSLSDEVNDQITAFREMMIAWLSAVFDLAQTDSTIADVQAPLGEARAALALLEGAHLAARAAEDARIFDQAVELLKARC